MVAGEVEVDGCDFHFIRDILGGIQGVGFHLQLRTDIEAHLRVEAGEVHEAEIQISDAETIAASASKGFPELRMFVDSDPDVVRVDWNLHPSIAEGGTHEIVGIHRCITVGCFHVDRPVEGLDDEVEG